MPVTLSRYGIVGCFLAAGIACMLMAPTRADAYSYSEGYYYGYGQGYYYGYSQSYYYGYGQSYYYGYGQGYYYGYAYAQGYYYGYGYGQSYYYGYGQGAYYAYAQAYYQGSYQTTFTKNATAAINLAVTGSISKGSGTFVIDHPLDPKNKLLYHSFVESPDVKNMYDGIVTLDATGGALVRLPAYYDALNTETRYQLKPIGAPMPNLHIQAEEQNNQFTIAGGVPGGRVSWQITGIRHDPYILANPIVPEVPKSEETIVRRGEYLFPEGYPDAVYRNPDWSGAYNPWDPELRIDMAIGRFIRTFIAPLFRRGALQDVLGS